MFSKQKEQANRLKSKTYALYLAARDPRTPWYARLLVAGIVAYALSPIDLIPDFLPFIGYLDDLLLVSLGLAMAIKLVPLNCRAEATRVFQSGQPTSWAAGAAVVAIWLLTGGLLSWWQCKLTI